MYPYIYLGGFELPVYGMIIIIAFVAGLAVCSTLGKIYGIHARYIICSGSFAAFGLLIGAKLLYALTRLPSFISDYNIYGQMSFYKKADFLFGGYVFYGGLIGAVIGVLIFCHAFHFDKGVFLNILTPLIPFAQSFGRIGCFFGGCCYGVEYYGPFAIQFPYNELSPSLHLYPRFPVQLVESGLCFILFVIIFIFTRKKAPLKGTSLGIYFISYGIIRFVLEFFRGDAIRGIWLIFSTSQWISLFLVPVGVFLVINSRNRQ